jgi:cell wall-associated NlpC family hydrolase
MVVASAVAVFSAVLPFAAAADPIEDQRAEVERITDELAALEEQADILAEEYVQALDNKNRLDGEVAAAEKRVAAKQAAVDELRGELGEMAVRSFIGAGSNGLAPMFTASSDFTADLQRDHLSRVALSEGTATTDELDQAVADLADEQAALEDKRDEAAELTEEIAAAREATDEQHAEYEQARADAEAELGDLIREEEERRARESYERMQREAEEAAARQAAEAEEAAADAQQDTGTDAGDNGDADDGPSGGGGGESPTPEQEPEPETPDIPPASSRAGTAVNAAMTQVGVAYRYAAAEPGVAFDCSGLTMWAWAQAGVGLPHQSAGQAGVVPHVPASSAQPGDLIFYYSPISHVGLYLGGGQMVHAANSGTGVIVASVNWGNVAVVGRPG